MGWNRAARNAEAARPSRVLVWLPTVFLASLGWAAFHEYGWAAWLALLAGGCLGHAVGDLAVGIGQPVGDACGPHPRRRRR